MALQGERQWDDYPSVGCGGTGDRKGRPYGPDKGSLYLVSGRSIKPVLIFPKIGLKVFRCCGFSVM